MHTTRSVSVVSRRRFIQASGLALGALAAPSWLAAQTPPAVARPASGLRKIPIGMNLSGIADWEPGYPFRDLMKGSRWWFTEDDQRGGPFQTDQMDHIAVDADGYPLELPVATPGRDALQQVFTILPSTALKPGRHVILYDGDGELEVRGNTSLLAATPGRLLVNMKHEGRDRHEVLAIVRSTRGNHVRNIRVLAEADEKADLAKNPFRPEFLAFCAPWHCLRFMDWLGTNNSINSAWSARKTPGFFTQHGSSGDAPGLGGKPMSAAAKRRASGMAIEYCIAAANTLKTDAWLTVPHLADDDYIERMAVLVRDTLDPRLKVYVEFSNEIWNWQFQQAQWMLRSKIGADLLVAADPTERPWKTEPTEWGGEGVQVFARKGDGDRHPERIGALFRRCFAIWERVFAGEHRGRLVRVCAVQFGWYDTAQRTLRWVMKNGGCDMIAPAHYFGPDKKVYQGWEALGAALTPEKVMEDMFSVIEEQEATMAQFRDLAKTHGVILSAYEAGQHIQPRHQADTPYNAALGLAQKHPMMRDAYLRHLAQWSRHDGGLWCAFASAGEQGTRWGSWGHVERYDQDPAEMPKMQAILAANAPRGG